MIIDNSWNFIASPKMVTNGRFNIDFPEVFEMDFNCENIGLTTLIGSPKLIKGSFNCRNNHLSSLIGCPKVNDSFNCSYNILTSLEHGPKIIKNGFNCCKNKLTSLEHGPKESGYFDPSNNSYNLIIELEYILYCRNNENFISFGIQYWQNLLNWMIFKKYDLNLVKGWPEGFLNSELKQSLIGINKFNL